MTMPRKTWRLYMLGLRNVEKEGLTELLRLSLWAKYTLLHLKLDLANSRQGMLVYSKFRDVQLAYELRRRRFERFAPVHTSGERIIAHPRIMRRWHGIPETQPMNSSTPSPTPTARPTACRLQPLALIPAPVALLRWSSQAEEHQLRHPCVALQEEAVGWCTVSSDCERPR